MLQSFVAVMLVTLMAVGSVVAQTTYSHTINAKTWSELGNQDLNGVNWTADGIATDGGYFGYDNTKGQQFGSGNKPFSALTLTTSEIAGTITSVKVNTSGANSVNATFKVKVGDTYFTSGETDNITVTNTATDYTFTGSASGSVVLEWAQTSSKAMYIKSVEITYTPAAVAVATPTFAPAAGLYYTAQNVAITCETADAIIHYTLDGTDPTAQSPIYSAPIAVNTTTTIKAIAVKGTDNSTVASATYTFPAATQLDNIAAFKTQTSTTELFKINSDVTVIFQTADKYHTFIQDSSAAIYVYGTMDKAYNAGDVIQGGLYGKYALYKEMNELKPVTGTPLADGTPGTPVAPVAVTLADLIANYAQYEGRLVTVTGVTVATTEAFTFETTRSTGMNVSQNGSTIQIYNTFKSLDKTYYPNNTLNVTGLVIRYNNTVEIAPRNNDDITFAPAVLPYMVDFDQNVDPGLVLANGNNTDKWFIGQPQGFDNNKLFISSTNGVTNKYDVNTQSDVLAFRDIIIPEKGATLSFDSRTMGENGDLFKVYIYNGSFHMIFGEYDEPEWNHIEVPISPEYAGLATLVFSWYNNGNGQGEQSPIAIDNISLTEAVCAQPIALNVTVNDANAVVTWTAADTTQNAWTLEYKLEDHNEWYSVNTTTPTATLSDLQGSSNYNVRVKANCGGESSEWTYGQFQVGCLNEVTTSVDTTITIGTGTNGFYYLFPGLYGWQYTAVVYEIAKPGTINDIAFYLNSSSSNTGSTMQVWVKAVDSDYGLVQTNTFANMVAGAQEIYNGAPNFSTAGWISFPISGGFAIPEGKKLMVLVRGVGCGTTGGCGKQAAYTTTSSNTVWYDRDDDNDPGQNNSAYTMSTNRPNIKININVPSVSCNDQLACEVPTNVTVKDITTEAATITWSGNATDYVLECKTGENDWTVVPVSDTTYTLTGLTQKTDYLVRVKAICGENNYSLYTEEVEFTTTSVCPVVTDITTSNLSTTTTISWTPGGDENAWTLRFRPQGSTEWVYLHINGIPSTTFGGLLDQTDYEVEVMALCDPNDEENQSSWTSYAFTSGCAPFEMTYTEEFEGTQAPNCWTSEGFDFDGQSAIAEEVGWLMSPPINIPAEGNAYIVLDVQGAGSVLASYRGTALNRFESIYTISASNTMQHIIIPVPEIYKDKAVNFMIVANDELEIATAEFTQCAFVPAELTASNPTNNSVELSWTGINNNGWVVEYAVANNNGVWTSVNVEQTGDTVAYTLTGLDGSTTYGIRVRTVCAGGYASNPSNIAMITTRCNPTSEIPYERFSSYSNNTFDCWTNLYTGTYNSNGVSNTNTYKARLYNYYNRTLDSTDIDAFGDVYAILPAFDTTLNVLQINFTAETYMSSDEGAFELGLVTDINDPVHTFIPLASYVAPYSPAANYTYILNNVEENGYLAFRMAKGNKTRRVDLSNILVEYIPACQKPNSLVATPISETSMSLNWNIVGIQRNWDIKYMATPYSFNPDAQGTPVTANERPRIINNLTYGETYTFYIRTNCGSNGQTSWVGPFTKKLELNYNLANAADITGCNGNIVFEPDTAGTNTLIVRPASDDSWIKLTGNVQLGFAMLKVYDGTAVDESKLLAIYTGSTMVDMTPLCANELTLQLTNVGTTTPVVNLAFTCETVPTCSAPADLAYNEQTTVLSWNAGCWGTPESYYITVENAQGSTDPLTLTSTSTSVVIPVENLSNGTYYATVFPICNGQMGTGVWTEFERVACADPTDLTVTMESTTAGYTAQLTWSGNAALGYEVGYKLHDAYSWATVNNVTTNSCTITGLDDNVVYDFRVKAICNAADQSGYVITTGFVPCVSTQAIGEDLITGTGTSTTSYFPAYTYYKYSMSEQIYLASELGDAGEITSVSFQTTNTTTRNRNLDVYIVATNKTTISSSTDWIHPTSEDLVFRGQVSTSAPSSYGWFTINLDRPFVYNGESNIVLIVDDNTGTGSSSTSVTYTTTSPNYRAMYKYDNTNNLDPTSISVSGTRNYYRNNVKFHFENRIVCDPVVSCPAPSNVAIVEKSENSVTFNWNSGGSEATWTVVYTLDNQEYSATANDTVYTITGLQGSTPYSIPVRVYANCDATHQSVGASGTLNFTTPCPAITTFPWNEDFENYASGNFNDPCWVNEHIVSVNNRTDVFKVYTSSNAGNTTHQLQLPDMNIGNMTKLVLPLMNLPNNYYQFVLDVYRSNSTYNSSNIYEGVRVYVSTNGEIEGATELTFVPRQYNTQSTLIPAESATGWYTYEIPIGVSGPCYIILRGESQYCTSTYMDNFEVNAMPTCMKPTNLAYANDMLSWTPSAGVAGTPSDFNVRYREIGTTDWITVPVTNAFMLCSNLTEGSTYEAQVQADCGEGDYSDWTDVYTFYKPCAISCDLVLDLEDSYGDGWNGAGIQVYQDNVLMGTYTVPSGSYSAQYTVSICNGKSVSLVWVTGSYDSECSMNITFVGDVLYSGGAPSGLFASSACSSCSAPTNFSINFATGILSWSAGSNGTPESYTLQYRQSGTEDFTMVTVTDTFYQFLNLIESSSYEFQIQTNCGTDEGLSPYSPLMTFTTPCGVFDIPYLQNFEDNPICWTEEYVSGTHDWEIIQDSDYGSGSYDVAFKHTNSGTKTKLITPTFDLSSNRPVQIRFKHSQRVWGADQDELRVYYRPSANAAWVMLAEYTENISSMREETIILPAQALTSTCQFTFEALDKYGYGVFIDDFVVEYAPSCFAPNTVSVSDVTYNSAKVTWTDPKHQQNFAIEYKAEDDTEWNTVSGDTTLTVNLTGLQYSTNYVVRVKAVCGEGDESEYTNEVYFTTPCIGGDFYVVGTGTSYSSNYYSPFYYSSNDSYTEMLYLASEINQKGTINSIAFDCAVTGSNAVDTFRIYMATTNKTSLTTGLANWMPIEEMTLVYEGVDITIGAEKGWETFTFNTPFEYNGTDNLLVAISKDASTYNSSLRYNATSISGRVHYQSSVVTPTAAGSSSSYRSNALFMICPPDYDLAIESIEPIADACDLSDAKVVVKLKNNSYLNNVNGFSVSYTVNGAETPVTETVNATILPQETYVHTFATSPIFTDGSNNILVSVIYDGDEVEDNNTMALNDIRQVVPATVPYEQDFSNVVLGRDAWTQGAENNNPNLWTVNNGVLTFVDNDTIDAQNYVITHCIEIPEGQFQISYDYNALSNLTENMNVYMGTTTDIASMTLIGSHSNFTKDAEGYTYNYLFNNENAGIYYFAIEATSTKGNMGITFDNLSIMPMVDVTVTSGPNGTVTPLGLVRVPYGGNLTLNIVPDNMYHTAGVWVDSVRVMNEDPYNASFMMYTLDNITEPHTIDVQFKMEFHIFKYAYNYNSAYPEVGGYYVGDAVDTTNITSRRTVQFVADEHYTLYSLVVGTTPPASEGAIIDGDNVIADVTYDPATRTYTYVIDTLYVSNYYVQGCFKMDTVAINYTVLNGAGIFDGVTVVAGEEHNTWIDYSNDHTSTIQPADGYYNMGVWVNGEYEGLLTEYEFNDVVETQYVVAQFGHKVTASISNFNNIEYLGSDEVRGTIEPADTMILSGTSCTVTGTVQDHFHLSNFFVNGTDMIANVNMNGNNFTFTIDSLIANTDIQAVVRIDTVAIIYTVQGGNGYVNGNAMNAVSSDTVYIDYGSDFMSQFAAASGYHLVNVTVNGVSYSEIPAWLTEYIREAQYINVTFALNEYDITTAAHGNGTVSEGMHVVYAPDHNYTFTATPAVGYHISQILRNNVALAIDNPEATFTDVIAPVLDNYDYVAYFTPNIYTITATAGENGTIDPYGLQSYEYGATPTFTVTANAGYQVDEVMVDGQVVTLTNGAYTFAPLTCNHTISVTFSPLNYTITAAAGNGGSITPEGEVVVASGSAQTFVIAPATGYVIDDVTVDNVSVGAVTSYTFENVNADHTINATFSVINLTITATAGANGTITPSGVQTVAYGSTPTFTVTADTGYDIDEVRVDGQVVTLTNGTYTFAEVTTNHDIYASFKVKTFTITVTEPAHASITPNGVMTVNYGATPTFTITPALGYDVTAITVNGTNVISSAVATATGYTYTFPAVTANRTLTASTEIKHFTITKTAGANGTITGPATVDYGSNATYQIVPSDGYLVENVTVDGMSVGAVSTYTFHNVTADHTINATFKTEDCVLASNLQTINIDSTSATLTWYHPGADSYDIEYKMATASTWTVVSNVPGFAYNLTNLQSNTTYVWQVKANMASCTDADWSNANTFKTLVGPTIGVADYVKEHVNVYAEHNRVHIVNDYAVEINNVTIYDMYGKMIYSGAVISNPEVIELNVAVGTYVVRLNTVNGPAVYKVHINR